jgi:predicted amidohydrolase
MPVSHSSPAPGTYLKVASIQYRAVPNKSENLECLCRLVREAAEHGAQLIVLPEMCTTGLNIKNLAASRLLAETIPGPSTHAFAQLALRYGIFIVLGLPESDPATGKLYNSQVMLGPDGLVAGRYRKVHLFGPDLNWAEIGDLGYQAVDTALGRIGLGICCDINYWEYMGFLSGARVDLVAFSTNWMGDELPFPYWAEMVTGRGVYLVAANNWGAEDDLLFSGGSEILAPDLSVLSQSTLLADVIMYADINPWRQHSFPEKIAE